MVLDTRNSHHMELLEDQQSSLCTEPQQAKSIFSEPQRTQSLLWYQPQKQNHQQTHRVLMQPDRVPVKHVAHHPHHHRHSKRIVLVQNSNPSIQKSILLRPTHVHSLDVFMNDVSELLQCLIRTLYTLDGCRIDSVQHLFQCPSILVCVGNEPFHPLLLNSFQKKYYDKLPKLVLKSQSNTCHEDQGCKKNGSFGVKTTKSVPPEEKSYFPQTRDDIEKRILVNKDGSLSMEMKVRFQLPNNEVLHCSTEIKKSSATYNMEHGNAFCLQHDNGRSYSETEFPSIGESDNTYITKLYQEHMENPHCQHCYTYCKENDIWKNPYLVEEEFVRHIRSSSSRTSSNKIKCKKASVDSLHTMPREEYSEQEVEKATCIQQTVGKKGRPTPPKDATSHQSTVRTKRRRRRLKVLFTQSNQPITTNDNYAGTETICNDHDDEYCPCNTCIKKRMASRPAVTVMDSNFAPVIKDFDLKKILYLKSKYLTNNKEKWKETENEGPNSNSKILTANLQCLKLLDCKIENYMLLVKEIENMKKTKAYTTSEEEDIWTGPSDEKTGDEEKVCDEFDNKKETMNSKTEGDKQATNAEKNKKSGVVGDQESVKGKVMTKFLSNKILDRNKLTEESETAEMDIFEFESAKEGDVSDDVTEALEDEKLKSVINKRVDNELIYGSSVGTNALENERAKVKVEKADINETTDYGKTGDVSKINNEMGKNCEPISNVIATKNTKTAKTANNNKTTDEIERAEGEDIYAAEAGEDALTADDQITEERETQEVKTADEDTTDETSENGQSAKDGIADGERSKDRKTYKAEASEEAMTEVDKITIDEKTEKNGSADEDTNNNKAASDGETIKAEILKDVKTVDGVITKYKEIADYETPDDPESGSEEIPPEGEKKETKSRLERVCDETTEDKFETSKYGDKIDNITAEDTELGISKKAEVELTTYYKTTENTKCKTKIAEVVEIGNDATAESADTGKTETAEDSALTDDESSEDSPSSDEEIFKVQKTSKVMKSEVEETAADETEEDDVVIEATKAKDQETIDTETTDNQNTTDGTRPMHTNIFKVKMTEDGKTTDNEMADAEGTQKTNTSNQIAEFGDQNEATSDSKIVKGGKVNEETVKDTKTGKHKLTEYKETDDEEITEGESIDDEKSECEETPNAKCAENGELEEREKLDESDMEDAKETPERAKDTEQEDDGITDRESGHNELTDNENLSGTKRVEDKETFYDKSADDEITVVDGSAEDKDTANDRKTEEEKEEIAGHGTAEEREIKSHESFESGATDESRTVKYEKAVRGETVLLASSALVSTNNDKAEILKLTYRDKLHFEVSERGKVCVNSNLVNTGESAEGGDEADDETELDEKAQAKNILDMQSPIRSMHGDDQLSERKIQFPSRVKVYTDSEDGADADGEDSETEVPIKNGSTENDDCLCNCSG